MPQWSIILHALKHRTQGKILAFDSREARVIELRLHQPVDVEVLEGTFNDARDLCFINGVVGVVFIAERTSSLIGFTDLKG